MSKLGWKSGLLWGCERAIRSPELDLLGRKALWREMLLRWKSWLLVKWKSGLLLLGVVRGRISARIMRVLHVVLGGYACCNQCQNSFTDRPYTHTHTHTT